MSRRSPGAIWHILTVVFGALPATWLGVFAAMGVWYGGYALVVSIGSVNLLDILGSLLIVVWSLLGLYGALGLWAVGIGFVNRFWMLGIVAGLIAAFPFIMFMLLTGALGLGEVLVLPPTIVGSAWLYRTHGGDGETEVDDELERDLAELRERGTSW